MRKVVKDRNPLRWCDHCVTWHRGECVTAQPCDPVVPAEYVRPVDRFPTRAPEGPFRVGGRKHR